jgi:mono/diheme cytochrome c family protein
MGARISVALFFCFLFLLFAAAALSAQTQADSLTANPVYQKNCAKCHGKTAEGRHFGGPSLDSEKASAASQAELREIIANGKGRMPKYASKLSAEQISTLVEQIRALNKK